MESHWTAGMLLKHPEFKHECNQLLADCTVAFRANDYAGMCRVMDILDEVAPLIRDEPFISTYEYTYSLVGLLIGITLANAGEHKEAFLIADYVHARWQIGRARREALGIHHVHHTEVRYTLLNLLGDLKWRCEEGYRDRVLTPQEMAEEWEQCAQRCFAYASENFGEDSQRTQDIITALGWSGVEVIKTATRYLPPSTVATLITKFNRLFGNKLAATAWHFRDKLPMFDQDSPWYWDYELCKVYLQDELDGNTLDYLWERREAAIAKTAAADDYDLEMHEASAPKLRSMLEKGIHLEVIERAAS